MVDFILGEFYPNKKKLKTPVSDFDDDNADVDD